MALNSSICMGQELCFWFRRYLSSVSGSRTLHGHMSRWCCFRGRISWDQIEMAEQFISFNVGLLRIDMNSIYWDFPTAEQQHKQVAIEEPSDDKKRAEISPPRHENKMGYKFMGFYITCTIQLWKLTSGARSNQATHIPLSWLCRFILMDVMWLSWSD